MTLGKMLNRGMSTKRVGKIFAVQGAKKDKVDNMAASIPFDCRGDFANSSSGK